MEGTCPVISDGCTKMEAPMIVPTTMAVACGSRMACRSSGVLLVVISSGDRLVRVILGFAKRDNIRVDGAGG